MRTSRTALWILAASLLIIPNASVAADDKSADFNLPMCAEGTPVALRSLLEVRTSRRQVSFPQAEEVREVEVGQSMIFQLDYSVYAGSIRVKSPFQFSGKPPKTNRGGLFSNGSRHDFTVAVPAGRYFVTSPMSQYIVQTSYLVPSEIPYRLRDKAPYPKGVVGVLPAGAGSLEILWAIDRGVWTSGPVAADYEIEYCASWSEGDFRRDLVYSGISGGTVMISYREFSNDLARPAFTQDIRYDLKDGREVGFRGARFEILSANNTTIKYRVIKPLI